MTALMMPMAAEQGGPTKLRPPELLRRKLFRTITNHSCSELSPTRIGIQAISTAGPEEQAADLLWFSPPHTPPTPQQSRPAGNAGQGQHSENNPNEPAVAQSTLGLDDRGGAIEFTPSPNQYRHRQPSGDMDSSTELHATNPELVRVRVVDRLRRQSEVEVEVEVEAADRAASHLDAAPARDGAITVNALPHEPTALLESGDVPPQTAVLDGEDVVDATVGADQAAAAPVSPKKVLLAPGSHTALASEQAAALARAMERIAVLELSSANQFDRLAEASEHGIVLQHRLDQFTTKHETLMALHGELAGKADDVETTRAEFEQSIALLAGENVAQRDELHKAHARIEALVLELHAAKHTEQVTKAERTKEISEALSCLQQASSKEADDLHADITALNEQIEWLRTKTQETEVAIVASERDREQAEATAANATERLAKVMFALQEIEQERRQSRAEMRARSTTLEGLEVTIAGDMSKWNAYCATEAVYDIGVITGIEELPTAATHTDMQHSDAIIPVVDRLISCLCVKLKHTQHENELHQRSIAASAKRSSRWEALFGFRSQAAKVPPASLPASKHRRRNPLSPPSPARPALPP